jgi:hypothetical protein
MRGGAQAFCSTGMCCLNPKSGQACSKDRTINFYGPDGKLPVSSKMPAGQCEGGKCVCVDGYSTGGACELLTRANSMARPVMGELDNSVIDGGVNDSLPVLSWRYLAKTCWGSRVDGNLKLELQFVADECLIRDCTVPGQGVDYSTRLLPDVLFYASYDKEFSLAAIAAESDVGTDGRAQLDEICKGTGAIFSERMVCKGLTNGTLASRCVMEKTYNVMNRGDTDTLVYLVVANCGLSGRVRWSVETSVKHPPSMYHGVCGARGTSLSQRCFSDAGGGCHVQEPALLKKREEWRTEGKISRAQIAMFAVIFSGSLVVGLGMIKYGQLRHKRQKQRQLLMRTRMGWVCLCFCGPALS